MKNVCLFILSLFLCAVVCSADVNVLIVCSTKPFDQEKGIPPVDKNKVIAQVQKNIAADLRVQGKINIEFEDVYRARTVDTAFGQGGKKVPVVYNCHSLAQWYFWPEGREERLANLKGAGKTKWDFVVLAGDPYIIANMPGMYAEGVKLIADTVREGTAKPVLLIPDGSEKLAEVICRVGYGADIYMTPAKLAAGLKGKLQSAYSAANPFAMKYVSKRNITFNHTGSSSENGIQGSLTAVTKRCGVGAVKTSPKAGQPKIDFNYGRGNSNFEKPKQYKVEPDNFERSYGFPMQENAGSASESMLYGIDKRFFDSNNYDDGTDLGIAWDMLRENQIQHDIRSLPIRLLWAKLHDADPEFKPLGDSWHMSRPLNDATATFMYTLLSGRCPLDDMPPATDQAAMRSWMPQKIGYETAWRMSHLTARAPGFMVKPVNGTAVLAPSKSEEIMVKLHFTPTSDVTVHVACETPGILSVTPAALTFTPANHATAQKVSVTAGAVTEDASTSVGFVTASKDPVFNQLRDFWKYTVAVPAKKDSK